MGFGIGSLSHHSPDLSELGDLCVSGLRHSLNPLQSHLARDA